MFPINSYTTGVTENCQLYNISKLKLILYTTQPPRVILKHHHRV